MECSAVENNGVAFEKELLMDITSIYFSNKKRIQLNGRVPSVMGIMVGSSLTYAPKGHEYGMTVFSNPEYWVRFPTCPQRDSYEI